MIDQSFVAEYCTVSKASVMLNTSDKHVRFLASEDRLQSYGRGALLRISIKSIQSLKDANPDGIDPLPRGYVYIIYWHGYYKIGQATKPEYRIRDISSTHPIRPTVIHIIPTDFMNQLETRIHREFASKRVSGEWFDLDDDDIRRIRTIESYLMNYQTRRPRPFPVF